MAISNNADDYANARQGIFFEGFPASLTGQCVSLVKWYLQEMCSVPDPQAARGNAKDYGDNLVRQGFATGVAESNRRRGDLVVWKQDGGGYGHIGVLLSNDRVFEQNVGVAGTARRVVSGNTVYASRTDPLYASWRKGSPTFYRVNSYVEQNTIGGTSMADITKREAEASTNALRVINSEVKGWNFDDVHSGKFDQQEVNYLASKKTTDAQALRDYIQQAWEESQDWRVKRGVWRDFYNKYVNKLPQLETDLAAANVRIAALEDQLTKRPTESSDAEKKLESIKDALGIK